MERFRKTIYRAFQNRPADLKVLDKEFSEPFYGARIMMTVNESPESIKHDYFNQVHFNWSKMADLDVPFHFIHGTQDSLHKLSNVKTLVSRIGDGSNAVTVIENTGHLMQYHYFHDLIETCLSLEPKV